MIRLRLPLFALLCFAGPALAVCAQEPEAEGAASSAHGAKVFQRCAACHLQTGAGVPGSFPPLAGRLEGIADSDAGRSYLVMAVSAGLMGEIEVDGKRYRGFMPAQAGLNDEDVAAVLNYAMGLKGAAPASEEAIRPFNQEEVAAIRAKHTNFDPHAVHALRGDAIAPDANSEKHE